MLTSKQKKWLRGEAQKIKATIQVGKSDFSHDFIKTVEVALQANELVKIHILQNAQVTKGEALEQLLTQTHALYGYTIGNQIVLYKPSSKKEKQIISTKVAKIL